MRRERAAAWAAGQGGAAAAVLPGDAQVQAAERVAAGLAEKQAARLCFVSGGIALGSSGSEGASKRQKTQDDELAAHAPARAAGEEPRPRTTLTLTLLDALTDKAVAGHFGKFGTVLRMSQAAGGRERSVVFAREEDAAAAAAASHDPQLCIAGVVLAETQPEATAPGADEARGGGFVAWAQALTAGAGAGAGGSAAASSGDRDGAGEYGWRTREGGLQALAGSFGGHNSASLQQADMERMLEEMDEDYRLPRNHKPQGYIDMSRCEMASMDKPIPENNKGHQMLLRMGWKGAGTGLGRESRGIYDPIPLTSKEMLDLNSRIGLGKAEEEGEMHAAATESRNALESEIQANESEDRRKRREEMVIKEEEIKVEVQEIVSIFRCDICDKQYTTDAQYQEHLNSYDHHHKKRFDDYRKEEKARQSGGTSAEERQRKEQKRMEKEMAARASAIKAAAAARSLQPPPPAADPPPPPPDGGGAPAAPVKFGFAAPKVGCCSLICPPPPSALAALPRPLSRRLCVSHVVLLTSVDVRAVYRATLSALNVCWQCARVLRGGNGAGTGLRRRARDGRVLWTGRAKGAACRCRWGPRREQGAKSRLPSRRHRFLARMTTTSSVTSRARPRILAALSREAHHVTLLCPLVSTIFSVYYCRSYEKAVSSPRISIGPGCHLPATDEGLFLWCGFLLSHWHKDDSTFLQHLCCNVTTLSVCMFITVGPMKKL